jgi:putative ABC transport system permease protein
MSARRQKILRDFTGDSTRSLVVIFAIAIGIAGFTAVLASYAILTRELNRGYLATNPASFTIRTDKVDDKLIADLSTNRTIAAAEARRVVNARIRLGQKPWRGLVLFIVNDYAKIRVSTLQREKGAWPPGAGEMLVERDAFQVIGAHIGDDVTVKMPDGVERTLRITGSVHDVGQAQARMENLVYGYATVATLERLGEAPLLDQINVLVARDRFDLAHVRAVAAEARHQIERSGHPVLRIDVPEPGKHPHAAIMGFLLLAMSAFGFFVMILSGIIVMNLLMGLMAAERRQIGVMKTLGATRRQIALLYFAHALLYGLAATAIAIPLGIAGSRALCGSLAVFLNFDIASFAIPLWVFVTAGAVGLLVPLMSAAVPVWQSTAVTIREALHHYGVAQRSFGATRFDRALARIGGLTRPMLLSIRNSFRRRGRLAMTLATLTIGGIFFMTARNVRASMIQTLDALFATKHYDLAVAFRSMVPASDVQRAIARTPGIISGEGWIVTEGGLASGATHVPSSSTHGAGPSGDGFPIFAMPAGSKYQTFAIIDGRPLRNGDVDVLVANTSLAAKYPQMRVGSLLAIRMGSGTVPLRVIGIAREGFSPPVAYIPIAFFENRRHAGVTNSVRLILANNDRATIERIKIEFEKSLNAAGLIPANISSKGDNRYGFDQHMLMIYIFLTIMSAMLAGVGGLGLMTTMTLNVLERRHEMGILRAIGAPPSKIATLLVGEGIVVAVVSWLLAGAGAFPLSRWLGNTISKLMLNGGLDFRFEMRGLFIWLAVMLIVGSLASLVPALDASRRSVREALGYE